MVDVCTLHGALRGWGSGAWAFCEAAVSVPPPTPICCHHTCNTETWEGFAAAYSEWCVPLTTRMCRLLVAYYCCVLVHPDTPRPASCRTDATLICLDATVGSSSTTRCRGCTARLRATLCRRCRARRGCASWTLHPPGDARAVWGGSGLAASQVLFLPAGTRYTWLPGLVSCCCLPAVTWHAVLPHGRAATCPWCPAAASRR